MIADRLTTVGVAVPVPEPFASLLRDARAWFGDSMAASIPTHVTLMPPLDLPPEGIDRLAGDLEQVASSTMAYSMALRGTDTFRPVSPVVFVKVEDGLAPTEVLAERARAAARVRDLQFPYRPHVTVAHHLADADLDRAEHDLAEFACEFVVTRFGLYRHHDQRGWEPHRWFELASP